MKSIQEKLPELYVFVGPAEKDIPSLLKQFGGSGAASLPN